MGFSWNTVIATDKGPKLANTLHGTPFIAVIGNKGYEAPFGTWVCGESSLFELTIQHSDEKWRITSDQHLLTADNGYVPCTNLHYPGDALLQDKGNEAFGLIPVFSLSISPGFCDSSELHKIWTTYVKDINAISSNGIVLSLVKK